MGRLFTALGSDNGGACVHGDDLALLGDGRDRLVAGRERNGLCAVIRGAREGDVKEAARFLKGHGRGGKRQAGAAYAGLILLGFGRLVVLLVLLVHVAVLIRLLRPGGRLDCRLLRLRLCRLGGLHGRFDRRFAVQRRPAEAAERQQCAAQHRSAEDHAQNGHHPLGDGVDGFAGCALRVGRLGRGRGAQALARVASGRLRRACILPQTSARRGTLRRGALRGFFRHGGSALRLCGSRGACRGASAQRTLAQARVVCRAAVFTGFQFHKWASNCCAPAFWASERCVYSDSGDSISQIVTDSKWMGQDIVLHF